MRLFTYDDWKPMLDWDGSGNWFAWNVYGAGADEILARYDTYGQATIYKQDHRGNVVALLNGSGSVVEKYTYDAFGKPTIFSASGTQLTTSAVGNRFMFQGREYLSELGLYDYRHRVYHPGLGRFLQTDPLGLQTEGVKLTAGQKALFSPGGVAPEAFGSSEMNLFRYCGDDPVDRNDSLGLYGRGPDFKDDRQWRRFDEAQKVAANNIAYRLDHMDRGRFDAVFGKGSATAENMNKIEKSLRGMLAALRDDGSGGHIANIARMDLNSGALAKGAQNGKEIFVHVENPFFNVLSKLTNAVGHEAGHNVGLVHGVGPNGATAYRYGESPQQSAYKNLPTADRLTSPDHVMAFTE